MSEYCNICLEDLSKDIEPLSCGHTFHKKCIYYWGKTCPVCTKKSLGPPKKVGHSIVKLTKKSLSPPKKVRRSIVKSLSPPKKVRRSATKASKSDDSNYILNPATGRYVSKTGAIGKKIIGGSPIKKTSARRSIARRSIARRSIARRSVASIARRSVIKIKNDSPLESSPSQKNKKMMVMLAHEYKEDKHKDLVKDWWMSEKFDGVCFIYKNKSRTVLSRNSLKYNVPDFLLDQLDDTGIDLHGEIWLGHDTFDACSGLARKNDVTNKLWNDVTFQIFDTPNTKLVFEDRLEKINSAPKGPNIKAVKFRKFDNLAKELADAEERGAEGLVIRKPLSMYEFTRSRSMLKVKSWTFGEAVVIGYSKGKGKLEHMIGALDVKNDNFGKFKVGSGLNDWQRTLENRQQIKKELNYKKDSTYKELVEDTKKIGKKKYDAIKNLNANYMGMPVINDIITFRYKEETKDGNPKFPTFVGVRDYE